MSKKLWISAAAAGLALFVGVYLGSPLLAANALRDATQSGNADRLQRLVDFPAVRESLKGQLNALIMESMRDDPELRDNPFAGFAAVLAPAIVNQAVDGYVTPDGLARMMQAEPPAQAVGPSEAPVAPSLGRNAMPGKAAIKHGYRDLDTYAITSTSADAAASFSFILHRQGLFGWKLARIELPKSLGKSPTKPIAAPTPTGGSAAPAPEALLQRWAQENETCRGGAGSEAATDQACEARSVTGAALEKAGWCHGENAVYGYQMEWRPCGQPRFASEAEAERAAEADLAAHAQ